MRMGFIQDYKTIILNMNQELVLVRCDNDYVSVTAEVEENPKVMIVNIYWSVPHVSAEFFYSYH